MAHLFVSLAMVGHVGREARVASSGQRTRRPGWRRRARATAMVLVALLTATAGLGAMPDPAGAAATLEVDAGYEGNFVPGRSVPVRVRIAADQLIRGVLEVRTNAPGSDTVPVTFPVEVSGGTEKEYLISLPTLPLRGAVEVVAVLEGSQLSGEARLTFTGDTELVGLLPGAAGRVPAPLTLPAGLGTARFSELDENELATPGALDPLGTIVTGADGLDGLDDEAVRNVLGWLGAGGHLVVDAVPGAAADRVPGLPDAWQPAGAERAQAGRGELRFSSGAAADGRWDEVVEPTPLVLPGEVMSSPGMWAMEGVVSAVARDGGLRIPTLGWLSGFLVLYVLLAGPVLFVVLRLGRRTGWAWLAVPLVAGLFATGAFVVGHDVRSGSEASHGSIVHTSAAGTDVISYVGLVSRNGADGRAEFPAGWSATGALSFSGAAIGMDPRMGFGEGGPMEVSPARVQLGATAEDGAGGSTGSVGEVDLDPGGFGMVTGWGRADDVAGLTVTAEAHADGSISGVLRNDTELTLRQPLVMVGGRAWGEKLPLEPGAEMAWELAPARGLPNPEDGPMEVSWRDQMGWEGELTDESPVNYPLWAEMIGRLADPYPTGLVVAAAWSTGWAPPIEAGGGDIDAGRTVFVTEAAVTVEDSGEIHPLAVGREFLRRLPALDDPRFEEVIDRLGDEGFVLSTHVVRHRLPAGADPATGPTPLLAKLPGSIYGADAWDGTQWVPLQRRDWGGNLIDENQINPDPFQNEPSVAELPPSVIRNGSVYLRTVGMDFGNGSVSQVILEFAS